MGRVIGRAAVAARAYSTITPSGEARLHVARLSVFASALVMAAALGWTRGFREALSNKRGRREAAELKCRAAHGFKNARRVAR